MHICFTGQYPLNNQSAGGVGSFTQTLARGLVKKGIQVSVIATYPKVLEKEEDDEGVTVYWLNQQQWPVFNFIRNAFRVNQQLLRIHKKNPVDIVEGQEASFAFIRKIKGVCYIIRLHGGHYFFANTLAKPFNRFLGWQERRSFALADAYIAVSNFVLHETAKYIEFDRLKAVVIPNPIDIDRFYMADPAKAVHNRIVFAGRLVQKKGILQLVQAMSAVVENFPDASLYIYGGDTSIDLGRSYQQFLQEQIPEKVSSKIVFMGEVKNKELPAIIEQADICVLPSHMEAMPIAWLEVMAMGKPLLAGRPGPGPEVIENGVDGLLCDPYSVDDIAERTIWMLKNKKETADIGKRAGEKIRSRYSLPALVEKNISHFEALRKQT